LAFRFVHTADLHLDSPLRSLALRDPALADVIANASRRVLERIVDLCLSEQVDALIVAGDLYDGDQTSMKTARFLASQFARLEAAGVRSFVIRGNHDAASRITRELTMPALVTVFGTKPSPVIVEKDGQRFAFQGISFKDPHAPENLLSRFQPAVPDAVNIGILHTSLNGAPGHDPYAPCSLAELHETGFDYWALGHLHSRAAYSGRSMVVMPGIPQGRDIGEDGEKSVTLVTISADGTLHAEPRTLALAEFARVDVDMSDCAEWIDVLACLRRQMTKARSQFSADHLVLRLRLTGASDQAVRLRRDADFLREEAANIAETIGQVWVEKIELALGAPAAPSGALGDLAALITTDVRLSAAFAAALEAMRGDLQKALPPEMRDAFETVSDSSLDDGIASVLARLQGAG
jgi:exonuclease SbcD